MSSQEPLRVLHLISSERWTGVAEPASSVALLQQERGCSVWVAGIWGRSLEARLSQLGLKLARQLVLERSLNPLQLFKNARRLRKSILTHKLQVVHSHLLHDHWLAALAVRGLKPDERPKLVRTVHRYETMRKDPVHRWLFESTDLIITVSSEQKGLIEDAYPKLRGRVRMILGGVNPEKYRPGLPGAASVRADMGEKPDAPVAGIVAHLGYNRGHNWLLQAVPAVVEQVPDCSIWIVGEGEIKDDLKKRLREPQFRDRVVLAGYRSKDLPETYAAMNVALLLGLGSEGSARAVLEAMSTECAVIAVRKGALIDTITDGVNGLLVEENNVDQLSSALIRLLGNLEEARRLGHAARQTILEKFTERRREEETWEAYTELL